MMERRAFLQAFVVCLLAAPLSVAAQQAGKVYRIGWLDPGGTYLLGSAPFRSELRRVGWIEGRDYEVFYEGTSDVGRLPDLAQRLVDRRVDVIVSPSTPAAHAARGVTRTIPIVAINIHDPVGSGLAATLARPGGNLTGVAGIPIELAGKQVELLKEAVPRSSRIAVLWDRSNPAARRMLERATEAASTLKLAVESISVTSVDDVEQALSAFRGDGLVVLSGEDSGPLSFYQRIPQHALERQLPMVSTLSFHTWAGGLLSYTTPYNRMFERAASYVARILRGSDAADLPIERPSEFELVINLKTAKALGLTIPPSLLLRADKVIE